MFCANLYDPNEQELAYLREELDRTNLKRDRYREALEGVQRITYVCSCSFCRDAQTIARQALKGEA